MKKFEFSFICNKDFDKMPKGNKTRYCSKCSNHIHDFTKMKPAEIAETIKNSNTHCGVMLPWQIDQLNEYLQSKTTVKSPKNNFINFLKAAAVLGSPLVVSDANALAPAYETNYLYTSAATNTEVLIMGTNGNPIAGMVLQVYFEKQLKGDFITDAHGKIYLDNSTFKSGDVITVVNSKLNFNEQVSITENTCIYWQVNHTQSEIAPEKEEQYDLKFIISKEGKERPVKRSRVVIELYDENNVVIETIVSETNAHGLVTIMSKKIALCEHVMFTVKTRKGNESIFKGVDFIYKTMPTQLIIYRFKNHFGPLFRNRRSMGGAYGNP